MSNSDLKMWMVGQLSSLKYAYRETVEGCYDSGVQNYGFAEPKEGRKVIVDQVIEAMKVVSEMMP